MQISLLLDRFQVQRMARAQLDPLDDFNSWVELTHAAATTAAGAIQAFASQGVVSRAMPVERSTAALEVLRATCTQRDLMPHVAVRDCEAAFEDVCSVLQASCDCGLL